ncbi:MAG: sugar phosphate isomerase/epimerase [Planctomycetota bacterium]|nr:sugar phosphate isomerase/epimerase [Planctomycetota bacterium]
MTHTRTGSFPIGFRRVSSAWQKNLENVIAFAMENAFAGIDVGDLPPEQVKPITSAGLTIGSVDLKQPWSALASADAGKRKDAVVIAAEHIRAVAKLGVRNFFTVIFPEDDAGDRRKSFGLAVQGFAALAEAIAGTGARVVIEGYPGWAPHYAALCCTPETYRDFFRETASDAMMINFDPSHLIRMNIDPIRFLGEFAQKVGHVHGKDTEILEEQLYEFGNLQPATLAKAHGFGAYHWRYTIPGHGLARWGMLLRILKDAGYDGMVSIELEDEHFNGTEDGEKRGFIASRDFLVNV